ncbi:exodeoxyribonuclease VII small subunit [Paraferrimonas sedimenticola]|uniref:Exodeoxyribonuclease 7 small subunit n=1 Tax=Paraferrimonas sedimenticola TaxID=375674 RepID=A0AA37RX07_9GAMM|nr:exodeoxyribonuclease VII small subunit [Paraferrimonas sedimenticola]GLP96810.1 exodeoxyribonuclease 7 small subunit [Paraferrimonas sedimenticola]
MSENASEIKFEQALAELEQIVQNLEQGNLPLEQALAQFEQGIGLLRSSQARLEKAQQQVSILMGNNPELADFDKEGLE